VRILLLVHRVPYPPDKGDKIRSWRLVEALADAHEVDLVTLADDPADFAHLGVLLSRCSSAQIFPLRPLAAKFRALFALFSGKPLTVAHFAEPAAKAAVRLLFAERPPEAVVLYSGQTAAWLPADWRGPLVADLVDVDSEKFAQYGAEGRGAKSALCRIEAGRLRAFERDVARRAFRTVLTTDREVRLFHERVADAPAEALPNGVVLPAEAAPAAGREPGLMVFVGAMDYAANVEAAEIGARDVLPRVRARFPSARFRIVGRNPAPAVRALAALPGVEVTGAVPDPAPHVRAASLALVPLRVARGVQNKVLEALSHGTPVVATPDVARSLGRPDDGGGTLRTGADAEGLAGAACALLEDPAAAAALGLAGRAYVAERYRWDAFGARFRALVAEAAGRDPAVPTRRRMPATAGEPAV
jgi:sugar transferase (PEP-CTERM/EpsH1 system associated)